MLPYKGVVGHAVAKSLQRTVNSIMNDETKVIYSSTRLGRMFNIKDRTLKCHKHNIVYEVTCPECSATYIGETARRLSVRAEEHKSNQTSNVCLHSNNTGHKPVSLDDFSIIARNNSASTYKRRIIEALAIKENKPVLNRKEASMPV
jgi:hypothetical protein